MLIENENKYYHAVNNYYLKLWRAAASINPVNIKSNMVSLLSLLNKDIAAGMINHVGAQHEGSDPN